MIEWIGGENPYKPDSVRWKGAEAVRTHSGRTVKDIRALPGVRSSTIGDLYRKNLIKIDGVSIKPSRQAQHPSNARIPSAASATKKKHPASANDHAEFIANITYEAGGYRLVVTIDGREIAAQVFADVEEAEEKLAQIERAMHDLIERDLRTN